jgi:hypothetical protein
MEITHYKCVFGGLTIPIVSFNLQFYSPNNISLSVVVSDMEFHDQIVAVATAYFQDSPQPAAELSIYQVKDSVEELITTVDVTEVNDTEDLSQEGIKLLVIQGTRTETWTPTSIMLTGASSRKLSAGNLVYTCLPDPDLRPGDTATINGETLTADAISWAVSAGRESMTVTEKGV